LLSFCVLWWFAPRTEWVAYYRPVILARQKKYLHLITVS
jgi:hypothetical protein